jgi:hypothetical protein
VPPSTIRLPGTSQGQSASGFGEELEQGFNSLHAQRETCEAFIRS